MDDTKMICKECGSHDIECDATITWRKSEKGRYVSKIDGDCFCHECNGRRDFEPEPRLQKQRERSDDND